MNAGRWLAGGVGTGLAGPTADGRMPPGLFGRMLWLSLLLHGALLAGLLVGVRLHLPSPTAPEARVTVKFDKGVRPTRPALERGRHPGPVSRPLARMAGRVRQPQIRGPAVGPGVRGTGGGGGRGGVEGLGEGLGSGDGFGLGGGVGGPVGKGEFPAGTGSGPLSAVGIGTGGGGGGGSALAGVRAGAEEVDLGVELLDVEAMDTGRHRALVVVDPKDRRALTGYLYLTGVCSENLERAEQESQVPRRQSNLRPLGQLRQLAERESLQGLADRMSAHTQVRTQVRQAVRLDDPALLQAPFVLLTVNNHFTFVPAEAANLGRYLAAGGFLYAEVVRRPQPLGNYYEFDIPALRQFIRAALVQDGHREGHDWAFVRLPAEHPLYHCYYDIDSLPRGFWDWTYGGSELGYTSPDYLEGIRLGEELVGLYSQRNFSDFWAGEAERIRANDESANLVNGKFMNGCEELPAYDLGVNVLVYALTREGSLAQQLVAAK